jgi:hypothetical protein
MLGEGQAKGSSLKGWERVSWAVSEGDGGKGHWGGGELIGGQDASEALDWETDPRLWVLEFEMNGPGDGVRTVARAAASEVR